MKLDFYHLIVVTVSQVVTGSLY